MSERSADKATGWALRDGDYVLLVRRSVLSQAEQMRQALEAEILQLAGRIEDPRLVSPLDRSADDEGSSL